MKAKDNKLKANKKDLIAMKDFVPDFANRKIRDQQPIPRVEVHGKNYICENKPYETYPTWESINDQLSDQTKTFLLNELEVFNDDNSAITIPETLIKNSNEIYWLRPNEYITEKILEIEIAKHAPQKNPLKFKEKVKEHYENMKKELSIASALEQEQKSSINEIALSKNQSNINNSKSPLFNFGDLHKKHKTSVISKDNNLNLAQIEKEKEISNKSIKRIEELSSPLDEEFEQEKKLSKKFFKHLKQVNYPLLVVKTSEKAEIEDSFEKQVKEKLNESSKNSEISMSNTKVKHQSKKNLKSFSTEKNKRPISGVKGGNNNANTEVNNNIENSEIAEPSLLDKNNFTSNFMKWMTGILEIIISMKLVDPEVSNYNILFAIS